MNNTLMHYLVNSLRISLTITCLCLVGCGDGRPARVPLSGQVLIDGEPVPHGFIRVVPENGRPAQAELNDQGRFVLSTFGDEDGCLPGTHKVAVIALETVSPTAQKWHAPKKYMDPETSGLTIDVAEGTEEVTVELTWDGGEPFEEKFGAE